MEQNIEEKTIQAIKKILPSIVSIVSPKEPSPEFLEVSSKKANGGAGFFISQNGLIVTNKHIISQEKEECLVIDFLNRKEKAKVIAIDDFNDVAFLKVKEREDIIPASLGESSKLVLGQTVIAVGNSLGIFPNSVSRGIISGLSRNIVTQEEDIDREFYGLIQTDAAINPGNSGGPLIDLEGNVVGINSAVVFGAENIGFALPIDFIKEDIKEIEKSGKLSQPVLGIQYILLDKENSLIFSLPSLEGALIIQEPKKGLLADLIGLKKGDVILEIGGQKINPQTTLKKILKDCQGRKVVFKILRQGKVKEIKAEL